MEELVRNFKTIVIKNKAAFLKESVILTLSFIYLIFCGVLRKTASLSQFYEIYFFISFLTIVLFRKRVGYYYWIAVFVLVFTILLSAFNKTAIANDFAAIVLLFLTLGFVNNIISPKNIGK